MLTLCPFGGNNFSIVFLFSIYSRRILYLKSSLLWLLFPLCFKVGQVTVLFNIRISDSFSTVRLYAIL